MIFKIFLITFALFFVNLKLCVSCEIDLYEKLLTTPHDANQDLSLVLQIKTKYEAHGRYLPRLGRIISSDDKIDIEQEIEEEKIPTVGVVARPSESDLFLWHANIRGPKDTPYEDGVFHLQL